VRPSEQGFAISTARVPRGTVVRPAGELDAAALAELEQALADAITVGRPIEIDLRAASFIDSSALWAITVAHSVCRRRGIPICLRPGPRRVQQVFEVTGLYDLLPFLADEPGAS
jgi:anti-anti-sigma factor